MPVFDVRTPTGRFIRVTAPEGATLQDAYEYVAEKFPDPVMSATEEPGFFEEMGNAVRSGFERGKGMLSGMMPDLASDKAKAQEDLVAREMGYTGRDDMATSDRAQYIAGQNRKAEAVGRSSAATDQAMQDIQQADGWFDTAGKTITRPRAVAKTVAESLGMAAPTLAATAATGGVLTPLIAGLGSGATEYGATIQDTLADAGVDMTDGIAVANAMRNPELMAKARDRAEKRGIAVGMFDAMTAGIAGRLLAGARGGMSTAGRVVGEGGVQMAGGMGGETAAQLAADGRITSKSDILLEGFAEIPSAFAEAPGNYRTAREAFLAEDKKRTNELNVERMNQLGAQAQDAADAEMFAPIPTDPPPTDPPPPTGTKPRMTVAEFQRQMEERAAQRQADLAAGLTTEAAATVGDALDAARASRGTTLDAAERAQELQDAAAARIERGAQSAATEAPSAPEAASTPAQRIEQRIEQSTQAALDTAASAALAPPAMPITQPATTPAPLQQQPDTSLPVSTLSQAGPVPTAQSPSAPPAAEQTAAPQVAGAAVPGQPLEQQPAAFQTTPDGKFVVDGPLAPEAQATPAAVNIDRANAPAIADPQAGQDPADIPRMKLADTAEQQRDSRRVASALSTYSDTPVDASQVRIVKLEDPKQQVMADRVGRILGRRIVFYDAPSNAADAFARDSNTIYISANAINKGRYGVRALIGHEFTHTLRMGSPELFAELAAFATPLINRAHPQAQQTEQLYRDAYGKKSSDPAKLNAAIDEELIADRIGDLLNDEQFWAELANENPSLFQRMIRKIISYLDGILLKSKRLQADDVFAEAQAMRENALDIMRRHADQVAREGAGPQVQGDTRMKIGAPVGDVLVNGESQADVVERGNTSGNKDGQYWLSHSMLFHDGDVDAAVNRHDSYVTRFLVPDDMAAELLMDLEDLQARDPKIERDTTREVSPLVEGPKVLKPAERPKLDAATAIANFDAAYKQFDGTSQGSERGRQSSVLRAAVKDMENATGATAQQLREMRERTAAGLMELGEYNTGVRTAQSTATAGGPPPKAIDTPELRSFMADGNKNAKSGGRAHVYVHGTATNPTRFRPKQGDATFLTGNPDFAAPYSASSKSWVERNGTANVMLDGKPLSAILDSDRLFETPLWHAAQLLSLHQGNIDQAIENVDLLQDYAGEMLTDEEVMDTVAELDRIKAKAQADPEYLRTEQMDQSQIGMSMMPLITNVKNTWDYQSYKHIDKLMDALREKYKSPDRLAAALTGNERAYYESWYEVAEKLKSEGNWTLIEDAGGGIPQMLKSMGFDSYHVQEEGTKNLAVFDPKQIKSAYGNAGPYGQRLPTAEEAASLGMTLEEAIAAQDAGDIRLRLNIQGMQSSLAAMFARVKSSGGEYWDTFHRWMIDEFADLKRIQDALGASTFGSAANLPSNLNAWQKENLRHGAYQDQRKAALAKFVEPMTRLLAKNGHTLDDFGNYLWWRHASERDAYLRRNLGQGVTAAPDALAGIDPVVAQQNIAALDPSTRKTFEHAARFIDALRKDTLDRLLSSGQITADRHANLMNQYEFWVPLRGLPGGDVDPITGRARGLSMSSNAIGPRATGRKSKPSAIIENMVADMEQSMVNAHKQGVLASIVRLVVANPDPNLWEIAPVKAERKWVDGVLQVVQTNGQPKDQLTFMHQGVPVAIEIRHEQLKTALLNLNSDNVPDMLRKIGRVTRWLSAVKTSLSPFFMLVNPLRDAGLASMAILAEHDMATLNNFRKFYASSYAALNMDDRAGGAAAMRAARQKGWNAHKMKTLQYAREFASFGGKTGYTYVNDIRAQQKSLESLMVRNANTPGMRDLIAGNHKTKNAALLGKKLWQNTANLFELANDLAENATRLAVFSAMREKGMSAEQAAAYAKEVTVNFNRRGAVSKHLNSLFMFFNAAAQGSARLVRLSKNPKFAGVMGGLFALSYTSALAQMIGADDDDDGENKFDKAVGMDAQRSLPIYVGNGNTLNLPVPYGPNMMTHAGYRMAKMTYDLMRGKTEATEGVAGDIAAQMVSSMSPIDPGKGWTALMPEVVRIPAQAITNKNDFGGRISPKLDDRDQTGKARYTETDVKTAAPFLWVAMALNKATGGDAYEGGAVNMTGEQVRYVWNQFTGGLGRLASESYELVGNTLAGVDPEPSDVPLANVYFRGKGPEGQTANAYYSKIDKFNKATRMWEQAVEADDQEMMARLLEKAPWLPGSELSASSTEGREAQAGTIHEVDRQVRRALKSLRQQKDALYTDDTISAAERRRQVKELDRLIAEQQSAFVGTYNQAQQR